MERAVCEQCGHWQPVDWVAGHLCVACGAAVRREVRCAWCAEWTPAGRFCRGCGCEVISPEQYGPARMLKSAGVDRFTLAQRLRELDPEQAANLGRIYNAQLAVVARRVEEVRLCESYLLQRGFSRRLEEELVPQLPLEKEALAALAAGPAGPFDARPEALLEIAQRSPVSLTRTLASIALLRLGRFEGTFAAACQALGSDDAELALEAALAFPHWRVRLNPHGLWRAVHAYSWGGSSTGIERPRLAEVAGAVPPGSPLRGWAAAAVALAWCGEYGVAPEHEPGGTPGETELPEWVREELRAGLSSRDPDLRFTCAMALGEDGIVARALESKDAQQRVVARRCLTRHRSPAIAPFLVEGPDEIRAEILDDLSAPLPEALVQPVLEAVERTGKELRANGVRLLLASLTELMVERLIRLARVRGDADVLGVLLRFERLPAAQRVVRAVILAGWFETLYDGLYDAPEHVNFADETVARLAAEADAALLNKLITLADRQLDRLPAKEPAGEVARFLARLAFGSGPAEVRGSAYRVLERHDERHWNWLSPPGLRELFGGASGFLKAAVRVLEAAELESMCGELLRKLMERWAQVEGILTEERAALERFVSALRRRAGEQSEAAQLLAKVAVSRPAVALPAVAGLLRDSGSKWELRDVAGDLLPEYDTMARRIKGEPSLAAELADALVTMLSSVTLQYRYIPALELLARLAQDYPALQKDIAARLASSLRNREYGDSMLRPSLDKLATAVHFQEEGQEPARAEPEAPSIPDEVLDNIPILPDQPLKTLAEYCAFLRAMSAAADPMAVITSHGMTAESWVDCMDRWGEVISGNDQIALRYARLMTPEEHSGQGSGG